MWKEIENIKLIIYDLDNTLNLYKLNPHPKRSYELKIGQILKNNHENNVIQCIVSCSVETHERHQDIKDIGIQNYINHTIFDSSSLDKNKSIKSILDLYPNISKNSVLFFDDDNDTIIAGRKLGINCINVGCRSGILPYFSIRS